MASDNKEGVYDVIIDVIIGTSFKEHSDQLIIQLQQEKIRRGWILGYDSMSFGVLGMRVLDPGYEGRIRRSRMV